MNGFGGGWCFKLSAAATIVLVAGVVPALAQERPVSFNIGVGPVVPAGKVANRFNVGVTVPVGITFNVTRTVGIQVEYNGNWMRGPSALLNDALFGGANKIQVNSRHSMHAGTFNVVFKVPTSGRVGAYFLGGPGVYHRSVKLTSPSGTGWLSFCDPYWFYCTITPYPVEEVLGSRSTTDFGFNVGAGVTFGHFYVELRYHYVRGPEFAVPQQLGLPATQPTRAIGHYVPVNFGIRF